LLAGVRPDFLEVLERLRFMTWYPAERFFPEEDETWSATVRAVRYAYAELAGRNTCAHCANRAHATRNEDLYYLV
jgi:sulfate permease, SulP family